ncbi:MAG: TonB family protein [Nitrospirae bacterium]|nr:TonB family protein [Nitrospirota bacterium]
MIIMAEAIQRTEWEPLWWADRDGRLRSRFVVGSILLHLILAWFLVRGLPAWVSASHRDDLTPPLTVTLLDPDVVNELPIGPTTHLPSRPNNLKPAPLGRAGSAPAVRSAPSTRAERNARGRDAGRDTMVLGDPAMILPPTAGHEPSTGAGAPPVPPSAAEQPGNAAPPQGLPFVSREEIDRLARLFTDQPKSKAPYEVNTEDLQYLSYIAQIARTLELIWKYPKEAGDRGQQGQTVLKITILEDGTLKAAELMQSSGFALLDGEALRAVKRLAPYQPLPKSWHRSQWDLTISFTYVLNGVAVNVI